MIMVIGEVLLIVLLLVSTDLDPVDRIFLPVLHLGWQASRLCGIQTTLMIEI